MRHISFGTSELSKQDVKGLICGEILTLVKKTGRFNTEPIPRDNFNGLQRMVEGMSYPGKVKQSLVRHNFALSA